MAAKRKKSSVEGKSPVEQIKQYLSDNKEYHNDFAEEVDYVVSSGSLLLDMEMSGGVRPSVIRASGVSEGGKTSCALSFARNFQKMDNSMVVYVKAEGRLSKDMIERAGVDTSSDKWCVRKTNIYEHVLNFIRHLVQDNPTNCKYMFIIDSMDALVRHSDLDRPFEESNKVAGGSTLSSDFLRKVALNLSVGGHILFLISQVRSKVSINPYEKGDPRLTNASGGNALLHYSDWILEFQPRHKADFIVEKDQYGKEGIVGHFCKIILRKTPNEKTGAPVRYPIKYFRKNGESVWTEQEIIDVMTAFHCITQKGAWINFSDEMCEEFDKKNLKYEKQHQGIESFRNYLTKNVELTKFLYDYILAAFQK